jgi:four helix bundle protein
MGGENIKLRTKNLAIEIGQLVLMLPFNVINKEYSSQIIRCSGSVASNYRAASRAKSDKDFINKLKICEEEADETQFWLEMIAAFNKDFRDKIVPLYKETNELLSIFVASIKTVRKKLDGLKTK